MALFADRVSHYPLVSGSLKAASDAYSWVASGERFRSIFQLTENAAAALKEKAVCLASTGNVVPNLLFFFYHSYIFITHVLLKDAMSKLDELACRQILDRLETVFPSVKKPTEELLGPAADRALDAAESYLEYYLPDTKTDFVSKLIRLLKISKIVESIIVIIIL